MPFKRTLSETSPEQLDKMSKNRKKMTIEDNVILILEKLTTLDSISEMMKKIGGRIDTVEKSVFTMQEKLDELQWKMNEIDQERMRTSFVLHGLPALPANTTEANKKKIVEKIFTLGGCNVNAESDLKNVYFTNYQQSAKLFGTFYLESKRNEVVRRWKEVTKITPVLTEKVILNIPKKDPSYGKPIFYFTKTTMLTRQLLVQAKALNHAFSYSWERDGIVFIRKKEGEKAIRIRSTQQLEKLAEEYGKK